MNKSIYFTGQPILTQLLKLVPRSHVSRIAQQLGADRYYKKFKSYDHFVSMMFAILGRCSSLREVVTGLLACQGRLVHTGLQYVPARSTLADANCKRDSKVFEAIYFHLHKKVAPYLPDSRSKRHWFNRLYIIDSTTISLFQEVLKASGRNPSNGKRKGGIKVHTLIKADQDVPCLVRFTPSANNDSPFMKALELPSGSIITMDRGYHDYNTLKKWTANNISFITRLRAGASYAITRVRECSAEQSRNGVLSDQEIVLGHDHHETTKVRARLIHYKDKVSNNEFFFLTNNFRMAPCTIARIYQQRWQIETLFKRIKQNYPLRDFLGDTENAIKIQIWCALITDLILKVVQKKAQHKWAFTNLRSMVRLHLMNYIDLNLFLNNPHKACKESIKSQSPTLFPT